MTLSTEDLIRIVERSSTILDRLGSGFVRSASARDVFAAEERLACWRARAARGEPERFARRLAWLGIDEGVARHVLTGVTLAPGRALPPWAQTLADIVQAVGRLGVGGEPELDSIVDPAEPIPFEDLLLPAIQVARRRLTALVGPARNLLSADAQRTLERDLLAHLSYLAAPAFELEFSLFRLRRQSLLARLLRPSRPASTERYRTFINGLRLGGLRAFFVEYAMLGRLVAVQLDTWVATVGEFLLRLERDRPRLAEAFGTGVLAGPVAAVEPSLSDPHDGGRTVFELTFASGPRLFYKPRDVGLEAGFFRLLAWLAAHGAPWPLRAPRAVERPGYGWVDAVEARPCGDREEVRQYFRRGGALLALVYALEGTDCHCDNLVASGQHPVLVDAETLLSPRPRAAAMDGSAAHVLAVRRLWNSVLRTSLLPQWEVGPAGNIYDLGGLSGGDGSAPTFRGRVWTHVNTDAMRLHRKEATAEGQTNRPTIRGAAVTAGAHVEELLEGFVATYQFLAARRSALLSSDGPLAALCSVPARYMFRSTKVYGLLLERALRPLSLRDGADWSVELDALARAFLAAPEPDLLRPLLDAELEALGRLDIPRFATSTDSDSLPVSSSVTLAQYFERPGFEAMEARLEELSENDLREQCELIRVALAGRPTGSSESMAARDLQLTPAPDWLEPGAPLE
ncbi:MAG: type 2 lanthipeptide synthetase LanM, partial [Candidatus Rokuibacteriota bacterium]